MRSSGLPTTVSALLKLEAVGSAAGGTCMAMRVRCGGEWLFVGSETEYACLTVGYAATGSLRGLGLDLAEIRGDGDATKGSVGVGGHRGLLGSAIGLEMVSLSIEELERRKLDLLFLLSPSVSRVNENARELLLRGVLEALLRGGVLSPTGTRSSTSLFERFSVLIVSSPSMVAPVKSEWSRALVVLHSGNKKLLTIVAMCLLASSVKVKASHCVPSMRCAGPMFVDIRSAEQQRGQWASTQPVKAC